MGDATYRRLAEAVLVAHQRRAPGAGCLCGWSVLGGSWAAHVAEVLDGAGALRERPPSTPVQVNVDPAPSEPGFGAGLVRGYDEGRRRG